MLDKTWDIPAMLEDYTIHLADVLVQYKKLVPEIMGGYMSAGVRQLKADPENAMAVATADFLEELPLPARLIANKFCRGCRMPWTMQALSQRNRQ